MEVRHTNSGDRRHNLGHGNDRLTAGRLTSAYQVFQVREDAMSVESQFDDVAAQVNELACTKPAFDRLRMAAFGM